MPLAKTEGDGGMRITTFGELKESERFMRAEIRNHPSYLCVWIKLNNEYKYLSENAVYDNNARASFSNGFCSSFRQYEIVWALDEKEIAEQEKIYIQWAGQYAFDAFENKLKEMVK